VVPKVVDDDDVFCKFPRESAGVGLHELFLLKTFRQSVLLERRLQSGEKRLCALFVERCPPGWRSQGFTSMMRGVGGRSSSSTEVGVRTAFGEGRRNGGAAVSVMSTTNQRHSFHEIGLFKYTWRGLVRLGLLNSKPGIYDSSTGPTLVENLRPSGPSASVLP